MIVGIGTDIVRVARLANGLERFGVRYAQRILAREEYPEFSASPQPAPLLAKRFAAKEAAAKALGTGFDGRFGFRDIVVTHDASGCPGLVLKGGAAARAQALGVTRSYVTLSDERDYAVAFVILERGPAPGRDLD